MNTKSIFNLLGRIIFVVGLLMLVPLAVAIIYNDGAALSFLISLAVCLALGTGISVATGRNTLNEKRLFAREGLMTVGLAWLVVALLGALPYVISGAIPNFVDAFFESASGFSTTGATVLKSVESVPKSINFWRAFTHWIGGMGVLVFLMAIMPTDEDSGRAMYIMKAEMPGPIVGKLVPRLRSTALVLYVMYILLTVSEAVMLLFGGMGLYGSVVHAMSTAGTGGFGILDTSIASYSPYIQWVVTAFMLLFSLNFNLYFLLYIKKFKEVFSNAELWIFCGIVVVATGVITVNTLGMYPSVSEAIRTAMFQVASFSSTTGFGTANPNAWPTLSKVVLITLMFIGGCAGSTAGGLKLSRVMIMLKSAKKNLNDNFRPHSVNLIRHDGKILDTETVNGVGAYFIIYVITIFCSVLLLSFEPFDFEMIFTSVVSCLNNIGPAFSGIVETPFFGDYTAFSKVILSLLMLLGRLELYPLLFVLMPAAWIKGKKRRSRVK